MCSIDSKDAAYSTKKKTNCGNEVNPVISGQDADTP